MGRWEEFKCGPSLLGAGLSGPRRGICLESLQVPKATRLLLRGKPEGVPPPPDAMSFDTRGVSVKHKTERGSSQPKVTQPVHGDQNPEVCMYEM